MKKNELIQLIKEIVSEEIRKELPNAIAEVFKHVLTQNESSHENIKPVSKSVIQKDEIEDDEHISLKESMREMFSGAKPIPKQPAKTQSQRNFTKNPILNEILNSTRPFSQQERTGAAGGMASVVGGNYSMNSAIDPGVVSQPISQQELMSENHVPLSDLPPNVSVMDVAQHAPPVIANALTRDYSQMMKLIDQKKGKI